MSRMSRSPSTKSASSMDTIVKETHSHMSHTDFPASSPEVSVIIPVYNEEDGLAALFERLYPALDALGASYEVILVNDGSRDRSAAMLAQQFHARPDTTRVILLNGNYGQHMAILAGFEQSRGEIVVTLDADLQNPPEEIRSEERRVGK